MTSLFSVRRVGVAVTLTPAVESTSFAPSKVEKLLPRFCLVVRAEAAEGKVISATMSTDADERESLTYSDGTSAADAMASRISSCTVRVREVMSSAASNSSRVVWTV